MNVPADLPSPLASAHASFLGERFLKVDEAKAAPGHRGCYAVVRQGQAIRGLVAVDDELGIWCSSRAEDQAGLRRIGFRHARTNVLASLYFDLPFASAPQPAAARPAPPATSTLPLLHVPPLELPVLPILAGVAAHAGARNEIEAAVALAG
ncbi:MAG: hypothetical protein JOZ15_13095 [Acidobacteria bacterium]|nr:hypothetical protein [Acidobacteriota bacterium]